MKKFTKLVAGMLALAAAAGSMSSVVSAAETVDMSALSASEMQEAAELLAAADNSTSYYVAYDYYNPTYLAPTQHYLAILADDKTVESNFVILYLNANIVSMNPLDRSLFTASTAYSNYLTFGNIFESDTSNVNKKIICVDYNLTGSTGTYSELFRYKLENISVVRSETALHRYTAENFSSPTTELLAGDGVTPLKKCIFALGDVDRNGLFNSTDSELVLKYAVKSMKPATGRSEAQAAYDQIAFEMAGDFNQDGEVDIGDVLAINQALA